MLKWSYVDVVIDGDFSNPKTARDAVGRANMELFAEIFKVPITGGSGLGSRIDIPGGGSVRIAKAHELEDEKVLLFNQSGDIIAGGDSSMGLSLHARYRATSEKLAILFIRLDGVGENVAVFSRDTVTPETIIYAGKAIHDRSTDANQIVNISDGVNIAGPMTPMVDGSVYSNLFCTTRPFDTPGYDYPLMKFSSIWTGFAGLNNKIYYSVSGTLIPLTD